MGCSHCISDAKPDGKHMAKEVFLDVLEFLRKNGLYQNMIISGGEPTEHPEFEEFMESLIKFFRKNQFQGSATVTTNGFWILEHPEKALEIVNAGDGSFQIFFQVSTDSRYYPKELPVHKRIWREKGVALFEDCVKQMYPLGRAKKNGYPSNRISSHCFNIRAIAKQLPTGSTFQDIVRTLESAGKFCTPAIRIDGGISLGESDLCPKCSSIYAGSDQEIVARILGFKCHICDPINDRLPEMYQKFL